MQPPLMKENCKEDSFVSLLTREDLTVPYGCSCNHNIEPLFMEDQYFNVLQFPLPEVML